MHVRRKFYLTYLVLSDTNLEIIFLMDSHESFYHLFVIIVYYSALPTKYPPAYEHLLILEMITL